MREGEERGGRQREAKERESWLQREGEGPRGGADLCTEAFEELTTTLPSYRTARAYIHPHLPPHNRLQPLSSSLSLLPFTRVALPAARMASTQLQQLPALGETYDTLNDFKYVVYHACGELTCSCQRGAEDRARASLTHFLSARVQLPVVQQRVAVHPLMTNSSNSHLSCSLQPAAQRTSHCTFGAHAKWDAASRHGAGTYLVIKSCSEHTCGMLGDEQAREDGTRRSQKKLDALRSTLGARVRDGAQGVTPGSSQLNAVVVGEQDPPVLGKRLRRPTERAADAAESARAATPMAAADSSSDETESSEDECEEVEVGASMSSPSAQNQGGAGAGGTKLSHPLHSAVLPHITRLAEVSSHDRCILFSSLTPFPSLPQSGPILFPPAPSTSFDSHTAARIHCSAGALQLGISLALRKKHVTQQEENTGRAFSLRCSKSRAGGKTRDSAGNLMCQAYVKIAVGEDGRWRVTKSDVRHSHALQPPRYAWSTPTPAPQKKRKQVHFTHGPLTRQTQQPTPSASPPSFRSAAPSSPTPYPSTTFLPTLQHFLHSISPSPSPELAQTLYKAGITSLESLVLLLSLDEGSLGRWLGLVGFGVGVGYGEREMLGKALRQAGAQARSRVRAPRD